MSQPPLVSIVLNNYNYERFVRDAIDSALAQTYPHVEVIVVDDGSTDGSAAIIRSYGSAVTALFKSNGGQGSSVNLGYQASRGAIVLFLDSDDVLLPQAAERVVAAYRPGVAKIQFRLEVVDEGRKPIGRCLPAIEYAMPNGSEKATVLGGRFYPSPPTSGNAYPREVLERIMPLNEARWRMGIDTYMLILACLYGDVASIDEPCGLYRLHGKNHSGLGEGALDWKVLKYRISQAFRRAELVREWAGREGLTVAPHLAFRYPGELTLMMALKLAEPEDPWVQAHSRAWLAMRGLATLLGEPHPTRLTKRLASVAWFVAMGLLPRAAALPLAEWTLLRRALPAGAQQTRPTSPGAPRPA